VFVPPLQRKVRKVGAPMAVLILLGTVAGLVVIGLTALNPVGTTIGFILSTLAMAVVLFAYLWLDRWEPEPPRLLILAFLWGASVSVVLAVVLGSTGAAARTSAGFRSRSVHRSSRRPPKACSSW
jgi:RsiW-degrading membrane proteinase PrsW (M82 family)